MGEKEFIKTISVDGNDRLRVRIITQKGVVADVVVQYEAKIKDRWHPVVRYDCSHGFFHRDMLNFKGEDEKKVIPINNLKDALTYAEQDISDRWEWYKERFKRRMK
ncbi:MAG TPA: hypothetical protein VFF54_08425 [Thermodesulfobacteriota bacterium]|nr:hypothetical protein [Thermodesulfobacteriota bacterium]